MPKPSCQSKQRLPIWAMNSLDLLNEDRAESRRLSSEPSKLHQHIAQHPQSCLAAPVCVTMAYAGSKQTSASLAFDVVQLTAWVICNDVKGLGRQEA